LPVFLTGDFNEPSHLDWTGRAVKGGCCQIEVRWPASERIIDAGLTDLYRTAFPDEVAHRGHTWTPTPAERDVPDRIDFVYANSTAKPISSAVVGESAENADIVVDPYPSDHRAVLAKVAVPVV
jgi:exonuclease III